MPIAPPQTTGNSATAFGNAIGQRYGAAAKAAYLKMVDAHPEATPQQVAQAFIYNILAKGLSKAIQESVTGTGAALGQASASGFGTDALGNAFGPTKTDDWKHLLLRIAEFAIGFGLIALGVWSIVRKTDAYKAAEKTAVSAAMVVPK